MTFYEWVNSLKPINTPEGDLVADIQNDKNFPKEINSWEELSDYLPDDDLIQEPAKNLFDAYLEQTQHHTEQAYPCFCTCVLAQILYKDQPEFELKLFD